MRRAAVGAGSLSMSEGPSRLHTARSTAVVFHGGAVFIRALGPATGPVGWRLRLSRPLFLIPLTAPNPDQQVSDWAGLLALADSTSRRY